MSLFIEKKWSDETGGKSVIEHLDFAGDHNWEKIEIVICGHKNKSTGCSTEVHVDGKYLNDSSHWNVLNGTKTVTYTYQLSGKKVQLLIGGYITNHVVVTGGGADITVRAYYHE